MNDEQQTTAPTEPTAPTQPYDAPPPAPPPRPRAPRKAPPGRRPRAPKPAQQMAAPEAPAEPSAPPPREWPDPTPGEVEMVSAGMLALAHGAAQLGGPHWAHRVEIGPDGRPSGFVPLAASDFAEPARALCQLYPGMLDHPGAVLGLWAAGYILPNVAVTLQLRREAREAEEKRAAAGGAP